MCCERGVLRAARCGRRTSGKRARRDSGLEGRCVAARRGTRGCPCARVMSRRRAKLRYGRRMKRTARNVLRALCAAPHAVWSGVCVWSEARNVMRAWRVVHTCIAQRVRAAAGMASRRRARAPLRGRAQRRSRAPRRRWLEPRSAASRARVGSRRARALANAARAPRTTPRASRSECEPPPAWRAGGERERRRADERSDAAERRGGAGSSRGQRRAERGSGRGEHEH